MVQAWHLVQPLLRCTYCNRPQATANNGRCKNFVFCSILNHVTAARHVTVRRTAIFLFQKTRRPCCREEPTQDVGFCKALVQKALRLILGHALNSKNTKTIGKHREVVDEPLYKVYHVAAWCHGTTLTKVHEIRGISFDWPVLNVAIFRCGPTKSMRDICCGNILLPRKVGKIGQSSLYVSRFVINR